MKFFTLILTLVLVTALNASDKKASKEDITYKKLLDEHNVKMSKIKVPEVAKKVMQEGAEEIAKKLPEPGLKVGEIAPDFKLKNVKGKSIKLSKKLKKGPVIISFFRGKWCPYCNMEMTVLAKKLPEFKKLGASLLVISPQKTEYNKEFHDKFPGDFDILSDTDYKVIQDYKLLHEMPEKLLGLYKSGFGLDLELYNGAKRTKLPVPGTIVLDKDGKVVLSFADTNYKNRLEPEKIIEALKSIKKD